MTAFVDGQYLTGEDLNNAFAGKFDAGGVSAFSATVLAKPTAQQWKAAIGLVGGPLSTTVNNVVLWDSTDGTTLKDSGVAWSIVAKTNAAQTWTAAQTFNGGAVVPNQSVGAGDGNAANTKYVFDFFNSVFNVTVAPLASPAFTGNPTAPTQSAGDNDTSIATTAFVQTAINNRVPASNTQYGLIYGNGTGALAVTAAMTNGQVLVGQTGAAPLPKTVSGDATMAASGALTVTKINGQPVGTAANNIVALTAAAKLPAVDGSLLTGIASTWAPGTLVGLTLSRVSATTVGIATGFARNEDTGTAFNMTLASAITKSLSTWAAGTGNGGLDTGSIAASTWYEVWLIRKDSDGSIDALLSLSATAPTMPPGYTARRRLGAIKTDGSSQVIPFVQDGDDFLWSTPIADASSAITSNVAQLVTLSVPPVAGVSADFEFSGVSNTFGHILVSSSLVPDAAPSTTVAPYFTVIAASGDGRGYARLGVKTGSSGQIRYRNDTTASTTIYVITYGWADPRGRL